MGAQRTAPTPQPRGPSILVPSHEGGRGVADRQSAPGTADRVEHVRIGLPPYDVYFLNSSKLEGRPGRPLVCGAARLARHPPGHRPRARTRRSGWRTRSRRSDRRHAPDQHRARTRPREGLPDRSRGPGGHPAPGGFAQLVWTLSQLGVGAVEVYSDRQLIRPPKSPDLTLQQLKNWQGFAPDNLSVNASGYFIRDGAVWTTKDAPLARTRRAQLVRGGLGGGLGRRELRRGGPAQPGR